MVSLKQKLSEAYLLSLPEINIPEGKPHHFLALFGITPFNLYLVVFSSQE